MMIEVLLAMLESGWVEDVTPMLTLTRSLYGHSGLWASFLAKEGGDARVLSAACQGNAARLIFLLEHGGSFSSMTSRGVSLCHLAGASGSTPVLVALHDYHNECFNVHDMMDGRTPLHLASAAGHVDAVRFLITHSRDDILNRRDAFGLTALHLAIHQGQAAVVGVLAGSTRVQLACGSEHALTLAVSMGKLECVQSLVRCMRVLATAGSAVGAVNILMRAAFECPPALPALLQAFSCPLQQKHKLPRVNDRDQEGRSALFYAASASSPLAIHALCAAGASLNLPDRLGRTCLQFVPAGKPGSERCRELLLNLGAALPVRVPVAAGLPGGAASSAPPAQAPASSSSSNMQQDPNGYDSSSYESESQWEEQEAEL